MPAFWCARSPSVCSSGWTTSAGNSGGCWCWAHRRAWWRRRCRHRPGASCWWWPTTAAGMLAGPAACASSPMPRRCRSPPDRFDLVLSLMVLHWVNDLPGTLAQLRSCLAADGLLLAAMPGGETLIELRQVADCRPSSNAKAASARGCRPSRTCAMPARCCSGRASRCRWSMSTGSPSATGPAAAAARARPDGREQRAAAAARRAAAPATLVRALSSTRTQFGDADGRVPATFDIVFMAGWKPHRQPAQAAAARLGQAPAGRRACGCRGRRPGRRVTDGRLRGGWPCGPRRRVRSRRGAPAGRAASAASSRAARRPCRRGVAREAARRDRPRAAGPARVRRRGTGRAGSCPGCSASTAPACSLRTRRRLAEQALQLAAVEAHQRARAGAGRPRVQARGLGDWPVRRHSRSDRAQPQADYPTEDRVALPKRRRGPNRPGHRLSGPSAPVAGGRSAPARLEHRDAAGDPATPLDLDLTISDRAFHLAGAADQ